MRYFLFYYNIYTTTTQQLEGAGAVAIKSEVFPSEEFVLGEINKSVKPQADVDYIFTEFAELKSEEDYKLFIRDTLMQAAKYGKRQ